MELFADDAAVALSESVLATAVATKRAALLAELAWELRQRDTARADAIAREALAMLAPDALERGLEARLILTLAECALLGGRIDAGEALADRAAALAATPVERGDVAFLRGRVAEARGDRAAELARLVEAVEAYRESGDSERLGHARAAALLARGFGDPVALESELAAIRSEIAPLSRALDLHLRFVDGVRAFQRGAFLEAVPALDRVCAEGPAEGLVEASLRAEMGLVSAHSNLGDHEASCSIAERVLARARRLGWPRHIGHALANLGRQLADAHEPARAVGLLVEAHGLLADEPRSRGFAIANYYLGDAYLALARNTEALEHLDHAERLMRDLQAWPEVACLQAIAAQALSRLGRPREALERAESGLALARQTKSRLWEVEALRSLAEIHATHDPAVGREQDASRKPLTYLAEALEAVESIGGHHEKSELYGEIARAHEAAGDLVRALEAERLARTEYVKAENRRATNLVLLAQVRYETERQRVEADFQRSLAAAETERARTLQAALDTIEQLRRVGEDITTQLDAAEILLALDRHLALLADVSFIGLFVFDAWGGKLRRHCIERGNVLPERDIPIVDLESYAARAARERREFLVDAEEGGRPATRVPGTEATRSLWFGPLLLQDKLLGVLSVQSRKLRAYGEREKLVFRTVSAYAAVALANARTHGELAEKHERLAETEAEMRRLATLDPLTGLANRRQFFAFAESEILRAGRYGGPVGLIMADLDRFKAINDAKGHAAGDRLLEAVAQVLRAQQRPHDVLGRLGGEEFAFVLPGADVAATMRVAERVRAAIEALEVPWDGAELRTTMSLGCAALEDATPREGDLADSQRTLERLMHAADEALYEAKRSGRNRAFAQADEPAHGASRTL